MARKKILVTGATGDTGDTRISKTPLVDKGFASVRKIGNGLYATISDWSKGNTTVCNGGFLVGRDAALLVEGFATPAGASFQMDALRMVSQAPVKAALDTHYHLDHSLGNAFYGIRGIEVWAHPAVARRIVDSYTPLQGADRAAALGPFEKRMKDAKSEVERAHAQSDLNAFTMVFQLAKASVLAVPNRPLDPAKLPMKVELGGLTALIESYPGHSGTDMVVRVPEHGQLCGQRGIAAVREVFDDIAEQAGKMFNAGVPAEEAQHRYVVPKNFKNFFVFSWGFTIGPAITQLYAEWQEKK